MLKEFLMSPLAMLQRVARYGISHQSLRDRSSTDIKP